MAYVYIVMGCSIGHYDKIEWIVAAYTNIGDAGAHQHACMQMARDLESTMYDEGVFLDADLRARFSGAMACLDPSVPPNVGRASYSVTRADLDDIAAFGLVPSADAPSDYNRGIADAVAVIVGMMRRPDVLALLTPGDSDARSLLCHASNAVAALKRGDE